MKREEIERLATDIAGGELPQDAVKLFNDYLANHPQADSWAKEITDLYHTCRQTVVAKTARDKPNTKTIKSPAEYSPFNYRTIGFRAAMILLAVLIGAGLGRWSKHEPAKSKPYAVVVSPRPPANWPVITMQNNEESFWHKKVIASLRPRPYKKRKIAQGGFWDKYRKYSRENHYE